jgi:hypothetical protein
MLKILIVMALMTAACAAPIEEKAWTEQPPALLVQSASSLGAGGMGGGMMAGMIKGLPHFPPLT